MAACNREHNRFVQFAVGRILRASDFFMLTLESYVVLNVERVGAWPFENKLILLYFADLFAF